MRKALRKNDMDLSSDGQQNELDNNEMETVEAAAKAST